MANAVKERLEDLQRTELSTIMDRLLARARQEQSWGVPAILDACIVVAKVDSAQGRALAGFLIERPPQQIQASIVPKIAQLPWASDVIKHWASSSGIEGPVKKAIENQGKNGNIAKQ